MDEKEKKTGMEHVGSAIIAGSQTLGSQDAGGSRTCNHTEDAVNFVLPVEFNAGKGNRGSKD